MSQLPILVLEASSGWRPVDLREVWAYRELLLILAWRDLKVRYRQTFLGALWVLGQPLIGMAIFTFLFNRVARLQAPGGLPYPLFVMVGLILWNFVAGGIQSAGNSLIGSAHLISKVYFPRLIIPLSAVMAGLADFLVSGVLLAAMMAYYRVAISPLKFLALPIPILIALILTVGIGLWISALNVQYRDIRVVVPFIVQVWMYGTPVAYPLEALPEKYRWLALANPVTGIVEAFRGLLLNQPVDLSLLVRSAALSIIVLVTGTFYFRRMERQFADII